MKALEACTLYSFEGKGTGSGTEAAPKASTLLAGENWSIMGDKDVIILKLSVGESPPKEKFKVETAPDQAGLVIRSGAKLRYMLSGSADPSKFVQISVLRCSLKAKTPV